MKTAVVILNWNGKDFLERFLPGLLASVEKEPDSCVIVADNASSDGSMQMMEECFPEVRTVRLDRNYGFTGGYNRALFQTDAEYFVLINSDIDVPDGWLHPLVSWMDSHPECGICAPKLHAFDRRDTFEYAGAAGGYIDRLGYPFCRGRVMRRVEKDCGQYDSYGPVFWASGACLMVRAELYRRLNGLDERFFAHQEEIDLCWRAQLEGYQIHIVPESTVYHVGGGTLPNNSPWKLYLNYRNNLLMLDSNLSMTYALERFREGGSSPEEAAGYGTAHARRTIFMRMVLDGCSAAVYLLTFRIAYFRSVVKAHSDYRRMRRRPDAGTVAGFIAGKGLSSRVRGIYRGWMIPAALSGKKITAGQIDA